MIRLRTFNAAIEQMRRDDPESCLTKHALRQMVLSGIVPHVRAGNKYLVNFDALMAVLNTADYVNAESAKGIRRIT